MTTRERIRMSAWGMIALQIILGSFHAYGGLMELKFRLDAVRTEARIGDAGLGPEWTLEIQWNGELHTARTSRLAGSPQEGDRIIVMIDPSDPTIAVSPGMPMQDWSELPWLLIMHTSFVVGAILVLRLVRPEGQEAPARPILQPGGFPVRPRRSGGTRPARRRRTRP